jgi:hypothetical protein
MNGGVIMKKERIEKKGKNTFTKRVLSMVLATVIATGIFAGTGVTLDMFLTKAASVQVKTLYDILRAVPDPELRNYVFAEDDIANSSRDYAAEKTTDTANYFAIDADTAAELQGSVTTYTASRDRTKALGSKENPFVMLEIVPTESKAMWGYHFPGYEPAAVNSVEFQTGNSASYSSIMGAIIENGENNSKEYYYTSINGDTVYVFDGIERFKLQQAYYEGKNKYKTVAEKEATAMDQYGVYVKAKNNNYTFDANTGELAVVSSYAANGKTYVSSDNTFYELTSGGGFSPVARILPEWNKDNISDTVYSEIKGSYENYVTIKTDYGINYKYQIYEDGDWKDSNKDAMNNHLSGYTTYIWSGYDFYDTYTAYNKQSSVRIEFSGDDQTKVQRSEYKKRQVYQSSLVVGKDKDMVYSVRETAVYGIRQFQSFVVSNNETTGINTQGLPYFHVTSNNLFLKYSVGLAYGASVYSATATVNESDTSKKRSYESAEEVLKAINNYHYVLVTITPEELNVNRSLIYAADMIGISGYADNGGSGIEQLFFEVPNTEVLSVYVNDNGIKKVFKGVNDKIKANGVNASTFVENDLDWSTTAAIFIRHIESDIPLIFDGSMAGKKIEGSSSSFMMTTYDYEENTSSNKTHFTISNANGEKNNVGKLFMLTAQLDPDLVYRLYWNCLGFTDSSKDVMNSAGNKKNKYTATIKLPYNTTATNSFHEYMFIPTILVSYKEVTTNILKEYLPNIAQKYNVAAAEIGSEFGTINKKQSTRYKIYITDEGNEELLSKFESQELSDGAQNSEVYDWFELIGDTLTDKRAAYRGNTTTQTSLATVIYYLLNANKTGDVAEVGDLNVLYVSPSNQFISAETLENKLNAIFSSARNFKAATAVSYVTMQEFQGYGIDEMTEYDLIYFGYVKGKDYKSVGTAPAAGLVLALWEYSQYRPIIFDDALVKTYDNLDYTPTSIGNQANNMKKYGVYCELNGAIVEKDWNFGKMEYVDYAVSTIGKNEVYYWNENSSGANWYKYAGNIFKAPEVTKSSGSKSYIPYQYEKLIKACSNKVGRFTSVTADYYYNSTDAINTRIAGSQVFNVKGNITGGVVGVKGKEGAGRNDIVSLALYVDKNLDGIYVASEKVGISIDTAAKSNALTALSTGNQFTITVGSKFDKMVTKAGSWCLRAYAKDLSGKKDVVVASTRGVAAKTKPTSKTTINVLQVKIGNSDVVFDGVSTGGDDWNYMKIPEGDMCGKINGKYVYEDKDFQTDINNFNLKWKLEKATKTLYIHTAFGEKFDYSKIEIRNWIRGRQNAGIGDNNSSYWLGYNSDVENLVVTGDIKMISGRFMEGMTNLVTADFSGCTNIEEVGPLVFWGCSSLEKVIFSKNSEQSISKFYQEDGGTFQKSKLTTIYLPNITGSIEDDTFKEISTKISEVYFYGTVGQWWNTCRNAGNKNTKLSDMDGGTVYIQKPYTYNTDAKNSLPKNVKGLVQQLITDEGINNSKNSTLAIKDVKFINSSGNEIDSADVSIINAGTDEAELRWHDGVSKLSTVVTVQVKATYKFNSNTTNIVIPIKLTGTGAVEPADTVVDDGSSTDTIADSEQKTISSFLDLEAVSDYYQYEIASLDIDDVAAAIDEGTMSLGNYDVIVFGVGNSDTKTNSRCNNSSANKTKYGNLISQMKDFMKAKSVIFGYSAIYGTTSGKDSLFYYEFRDYLNLTKFLNENNSYSSYIVNAKAAPYVAANSQNAGINLREEYQLYLNQLTEFPYTLADNANSGGGALVGKAGNHPYYRLFMSDITNPRAGTSDNGTINTEVIYSFIEKPLALATDGTTSKIDVNSSYYAYTTTGRVSGSETTKFYIGMSNSPTAIEKELLINMLVAASTLTENGLSFTVYNDVQTNVSGNKTYLYYMTDAATKEVVGAVELDSKNSIHNSEGGITYKKDVYGLPLRIVKEIEKLVSSAPKIGRQRLSLTNIIKPKPKYIDGNGNESTSWWTYEFSDKYQTDYFYVGELYDGAVIYEGNRYRTYDSGEVVYYVKNSGDKINGKIEGGYVYKYNGKQSYEFDNLADYFAEYKNSSNWTKVKWSEVERDSYFSVYDAILKSVGTSTSRGEMYVYSRTWITHTWYSRKIRTWLKYLDGGTSFSDELVISGEDEVYVGDTINFALVDDKGLISGYSSFIEWLLALIFGGHRAETVWTSSNKSVASIEGNNNTATLKGKSAGTTEISFKIDYYKTSIWGANLEKTYNSNKITVTVKEKVPEDVAIEGPIDVEKGKTAKYTAHVLPEDVDGSVTWYTTNSDIATIAADGTLTGVAVGTTEVYAKSGSIESNHITVNVLEPVIAVKTLTLSDQEVNIGDTASFKPVIDPENATCDYIKWTVADGIGTLVKVENTPALDGNYYTSDETKGFELTGLAVGEVPVTVEIIREGAVLKSASATLKITDNIVELTDATLSLPDSINVGETSDSLQVLLTPEGASKVTVDWELTGDNPETYATITANVEDSKKASLKGLKAGEAKVKATVYQKGNKVKELTGTVEIKALPMLTIDGPISVEVGETITYKATVLEGHSVADVEWVISDSSIARLNHNKGKTVTITGMKMGTVTLTATLEGFTVTATIAVTDDFGYFKRVYFSLDDTVPLEGEYFRTFFFLDDADDNYENNEHEYNKYANSANKISEIISPIVENNNFDIFTSELSKDSTNEATKLSENEIREVNRRTARSDKNGAVIEVYSYNENTKTGTKVTYDSTKKSYVLYPNQVYYVDVRLNPSVCTMPEITIMGILYRENKSANLMVTRNIQIIPMNMFNLD